MTPGQLSQAAYAALIDPTVSAATAQALTTEAAEAYAHPCYCDPDTGIYAHEPYCTGHR